MAYMITKQTTTDTVHLSQNETMTTTTMMMMTTTTATKTKVTATTQKKITPSGHIVYYPIAKHAGTQSYSIISVTF